MPLYLRIDIIETALARFFPSAKAWSLNCFFEPDPGALRNSRS